MEENLSLKNIILVIVGLKGETHGYEILKELEKLAIGMRNTGER